MCGVFATVLPYAGKAVAVNWSAIRIRMLGLALTPGSTLDEADGLASNLRSR